MRRCKISRCKGKYYGCGWCQKHYTRWWKWGNPYKIKIRIYKISNKGKCIVQGCENEQEVRHYCRKHYIRVRLYGNPLIKHSPPGRNIKGKLNPRWKGGVAEYPNHTLLKKNRLIRLSRNPYCEKCGIKATEIHHRNGDKSDHRLVNLMSACHPCNSKIRFKPNNTKYRRKYGKSLVELGKQYDLTYAAVYSRLKHNIPLNRPRYERR